jgi:hypothetical protein
MRDARCAMRDAQAVRHPSVRVRHFGVVGGALLIDGVSGARLARDHRSGATH